MNRRKNYYGTASLLIAFGLGAAAYAIYRCTKNDENHGFCMHRGCKEKRFKNIYSILENKMGITEEEVNEAISEGKTVFDVVKDKGFSEEQLKDFIINERCRKIDELVLNRKITRDLGERIKNKIRIKMYNWDGRLE